MRKVHSGAEMAEDKAPPDSQSTWIIPHHGELNMGGKLDEWDEESKKALLGGCRR